MRDRVPDAHEDEVLGPPAMERKRRRPSSKEVVVAAVPDVVTSLNYTT